MLYQTVHQKPIVSGYISRTPTSVRKVFEPPFLNELRARIYGDTEPYRFDKEILANAEEDIQALGVGYIVLYRDSLSAQDFEIIRAAFVPVFSDPGYEDEMITVWKIRKDLTEIHQLNHRLSKCLAFKTLSEVFEKKSGVLNN